MLGPGLRPPLPAVRINNKLLVCSSVSDPSRDRVESFSSTLRRRRNMAELDGLSGASFLGAATMNCKTVDQNEGERECEVPRRKACHAPRSASRVFPSEHVRPQTVRADDTVVGYAEQTLANSLGPTAPMAASTPLPNRRRPLHPTRPQTPRVREIIGSRLVSRIICTTFDTGITS